MSISPAEVAQVAAGAKGAPVDQVGRILDALETAFVSVLRKFSEPQGEGSGFTEGDSKPAVALINLLPQVLPILREVQAEAKAAARRAASAPPPPPPPRDPRIPPGDNILFRCPICGAGPGVGQHLPRFCPKKPPDMTLKEEAALTNWCCRADKSVPSPDPRYTFI